MANPPRRGDAKADAALVGKRIASLRQVKSLSVPDLAVSAGISKGYLWQLENGEDPNPSIGVLTKIADALETTAADLLGQPVISVKTSRVPSTLPAGLREFLEEQKRRGEPVREDIVRALAQLQARGGKADWAFLYETIKRATVK